MSYFVRWLVRWFVCACDREFCPHAHCRSLPDQHMAKAHVLALMGDNAKAHAELGKAHQASSSRDEASDVANGDRGDSKRAGSGFRPDVAMSLLRESNPSADF